ncbi:MAG: PIN domain-containing protein [Candidatus Rokubacteria bacterium]|nr:PIN domain-containing protein [Candidatus Rokubacteria bacterium]
MPKVQAALEAAEVGRGAVYMSLIALLPITRETVLAAAHVKARFALSYADAFAVVAARDHDATVLTGDPEFAPVADAGVVSVEWLPRR